MTDSELATARRRVTDALYAMHTLDNMIVIDEKLAQELDEAWSAYDVAVIESAVADLRRRT